MYVRAVHLDVTPLPASPVPPDVLDRAGTLIDAIRGLAERYPDYECLTVLTRDRKERRLTIGSIWERAREIQASMVERGLARGEYVVIALPTGPELVAAYFGVMLAGGAPALVATPSNRVADRSLYAERLGAVVRNANAWALIGDDEVAAIFRAAPGALPPRTALLTPAELPGTGAAVAPAKIDPDQIATVQYSSGSTGPPKGVLLTHRAILNNMRAVRRGLGLTNADVGVNWVPLYHDMGLIDTFVLPLLSGCPAVLIPTMDFMREPALWLWAIHHYRGAQSWAPNFAYALCAKRVPDEELTGLDLSSWRLALSGAEPVLAETVRAFAARFRSYGFRPEAMTPIWGMAENVTVATAHPLDEAPRVETIDRALLAVEQRAEPIAGSGVEVVSVGTCLPEAEVEIRDENRRPLPERHVGAIWLRSAYLFTAYNRDAAATAEALVDGWFDTGDRGYVAGGHLFFVARDKDLIVVGGEKYVPHDVETVINSVPGVREGCAVAFGVMNEERGTEDLAAVVETKETDAAALARLGDAIRSAVLRAVGIALRHVVLVPPGGVEKTTSGKLARRATRARYADRLT